MKKSSDHTSTGISKIWKRLDSLLLISAGALFSVGSYIAPVASFLNIPASLGPLIVGMLAVLAWSQLRSRHEVSQEVLKWRSTRTEIFTKHFPQEYLDAQEKLAYSYFYSGTTMQRTITAMREHLKRILSSGGTVRILLPDPSDGLLLELIAKTHPDKTAASIGDDIRNAFRIAQELGHKYEGVALRTIDFPPSIGINALDIDKPAAMIMVQMYEFKGTTERAPIFLLQKGDDPWFEHFRVQIDRLWENGTDYPLDRSRSPESMDAGSPGQTR